MLWSESAIHLRAGSRTERPSAFENDIPYVTAIIALEEGPHLLSNIVGCGPEEVYCDMPVEVTWEDIDKAISLPIINLRKFLYYAMHNAHPKLSLNQNSKC